jgi:hypothetical protein
MIGRGDFTSIEINRNQGILGGLLYGVLAGGVTAGPGLITAGIFGVSFSSLPLALGIAAGFAAVSWMAAYAVYNSRSRKWDRFDRDIVRKLKILENQLQES